MINESGRKVVLDIIETKVRSLRAMKGKPGFDHHTIEVVLDHVLRIKKAVESLPATQFLSVQEMMEKTGKSKSQVCYDARKGILPGIKVGGTWVFEIEGDQPTGYDAIIPPSMELPAAEEIDALVEHHKAQQDVRVIRREGEPAPPAEVIEAITQSDDDPLAGLDLSDVDLTPAAPQKPSKRGKKVSK